MTDHWFLVFIGLPSFVVAALGAFTWFTGMLDRREAAEDIAERRING